jgi:hypothetical protein
MEAPRFELAERDYVESFALLIGIFRYSEIT